MDKAQEVASALVRFVGDLKPLEKDTDQAKKSLDNLSKHNFGKALSDGALSAGRSMLDLSKNIFFVREALTTVIGLAGSFARAFLAPAMELEKSRDALTVLMGSSEQADALLGKLDDTANRFGLDLKGLQEQAVSLAVISEGDVAVANDYAMALARINALRPDLPQQRQLGVVFALREGDMARASMLLDVPKEKLEALAGVAQETSDQVSEAVGNIGGGGEEALGRYTSIVREAESAGACGKNLAENIQKGLSTAQINNLLSALGASDAMMAKVAGSTKSKLQILANDWLKFRQTVGMQVLEALAGPLDNLLGWLTKNEDKLTELAVTFGGILADAVQRFLEWLTPERLDAIAASLINIAGAVGSLVSGFIGLPLWVQKLLVGGAVGLGPMGGGKLLGGLALKGVGKALGGGAAAAGAGEVAAGGTAAAAGGLTGLGIGASILGGVGAGLGVNELLSRTEWGQQAGIQPSRNVLSVGAYGLGSLLGGEELGNKWFSGVSGIQPGQGTPQQVEVHVTVDDEGALRAYTEDTIGRNNSDIISGWAGGGPSSVSFAAWSGAGG